MSTEVKPIKAKAGAKWYEIEYKASDYTFPSDEPRIDRVWFDNEYMHVALEDGRRLSIPLAWIPTVYHASPEEREKYQISRSRTMIVWDPDQCTINDEVRIRDYLVGLPKK
jgi:hypothetical protein